MKQLRYKAKTKTKIEMEKIVIRKIENQIRQQLFGTLMLVVAGLMLVNSFGLVYADTDDTDLTFNVTEGGFAIVNVPASMAFASQVAGTITNIIGNEEVDGPTVTDYRGTSTAWSVAVAANNFEEPGGNIIDADQLTLYQDTAGVLTSIENCTTSYILIGANGTLNDAGATLMNGSTQASGIVQFDDGFVNLTLDGTENQGDYGAVMTFTLA